MTTDEKLDQILELLQTLVNRGKPRVSRQRGAMEALTGSDLLTERVKTLEAIFWKLVNASTKLRRDTYRFPSYLIEPITQTYHRQALVVSVLCNQAALRKCFKTTKEEEKADLSPTDIARAVLEHTNLVCVRALDTDLGSQSETLVALSPLDALRHVRDRSLLPREWRGWTTASRAAASLGLDDNLVEPPPCPSDAVPIPVTEDDDDDLAKFDREAMSLPETKPVRPVNIGKTETDIVKSKGFKPLNISVRTSGGE